MILAPRQYPYRIESVNLSVGSNQLLRRILVILTIAEAGSKRMIASAAAKAATYCASLSRQFASASRAAAWCWWVHDGQRYPHVQGLLATSKSAYGSPLFTASMH